MVDKVVIYPRGDGGICILWPSKEHPIEEVINKDVPPGLPYKILDSTDLPRDGVWRDAWTADFSNPDGHSTGVSEYFAQLNSQELPEFPVVSDKDKPWPKV